MYTVAILEDNDEHAQLVRRQLEASPHGSRFRIERFRSEVDLESALSAGARIDVLVADVQLGDGDRTGIDVVGRLFPPGCGTQVIYLTSYAEYCSRAYRTAHVWYLLKPAAQRDLDDALSRALGNLERARSRAIAVQSRGQTVSIAPSSIVYVESDRRKVRIVMRDDAVESYASLDDIERLLPASFVRCHKSFLANMDLVARLGKDGLEMATGCVVPVSQRRRAVTREALMAYLRTGK